jgi:hypothetical protein
MSETSLVHAWLCGCTAEGAVLSVPVVWTEASNGPCLDNASPNCPDTERVLLLPKGSFAMEDH